ncbi:YppG family protein [Bacillus sp. AFS040349]|uniref:YppG family protein n=1 Tax=Bacillus sp. AFS040349 TaxID=2033502 RepID=UPI000BFE1AEE|nr:YppG family protein [Bacillus sp. AFS040349]PGT79781.1 hypothetical protein COD11_21990 [Bacillus sp. AFS040349]
MFNGRRPMPRVPYQRPLQGPHVPTSPNFLSHFQTSDGKFDFDKISATAQQIHKLYNQVSPMITKFIKK